MKQGLMSLGSTLTRFEIKLVGGKKNVGVLQTTCQGDEDCIRACNAAGIYNECNEDWNHECYLCWNGVCDIQTVPGTYVNC
ncbi:MAG: hypothetical protein QM528_02940 [Phycisphaerales bacterium]|nr:hypothetical protein [Phycisphaerales bacterium]